MAEKVVENKGLFQAYRLVCCQVEKRYLNQEQTDYYFNIGFTNGEQIVQMTCGKGFESVLKPFATYDVGVNYIDKKLKIVYLNPHS